MESPKVFLVGPMGSGKSTVARTLAGLLGWSWLDLDSRIQRKADQTIPEIFNEEGEVGFRDREEQVLEEVAAQEQALVVATGGGVVLRPANRLRMRQAGRMVYLWADVDTLLKRVAGDANRPLLQVADPRAKLAALQEAREPLYQEADRIENTAEAPPETVAARLAEWVRNQFPEAGTSGSGSQE
ncbi:MAG: shikimate kinase [Thiohalorhabdus sp.]|uniref:shikimate kinase n=1 Tax=Thiohalorhabdus sp. TaxID=3094134 RepID=UPI002FC384CE